MKKRMVSLLLAAVFCVGCLPGCGSSTSAPTPAQSQMPQPSADSQATPDVPTREPIPVSPSQSPDTTVPATESPRPSVEEPSVEPEASVSHVPTADPEPEETATVAPAPTPDPSEARSILNAAALSPMKTNDASLDTEVERILDRILTDSMDTYEKVKACYDYLIDNTVYQTKTEATVIRSGVYTSSEDYKNVLLTSEVLSEGKGVCDHYAAALHVLTRRIGLESYICTGKHASQKGGMGGHVWTIITVNGTDYIFDAQIDDTNGTSDKRFCKTFEEMGSRYQDYDVASNKAAFCNFQRADSSGSAGGGTDLQELFASDPLLTENAEEAILYSEAVAKAATDLREQNGMSGMRSDPGAALVACYCATVTAMGERITQEQAANLMVGEGVSFRYVTVIGMGTCVDPQELVATEQAAFTNPNFDGFAAGVFDEQWTVIFYGG